MREHGLDQAQGLRRLFRPCAFQPFVVTGTGRERGAAALVLTSALSTLGHRVLLVDLDRSAPVHRSERGPGPTLGDCRAGRCTLANAAVALDQRGLLIDGADAIDGIVAAGAESLEWLGRQLVACGGPHAGHAVVFGVDPARLPAVTAWVGAHARNVLAIDPSPASVTEGYALAKSLAQAGAAGELDVVAVARSGAAATDAAIQRLARTCARFLPLELRRLAVLDGTDVEALLRTPASTDITYSAALRARLGRALAGPVGARWPEVASRPPAAVRLEAVRPRGMQPARAASA